MSENLIHRRCPACLCLPNTEYNLPCGHKLCYNCLEMFVHKRIVILLAQGTKCDDEDEVPVICPVCRVVCQAKDAVECVVEEELIPGQKVLMCGNVGCENEAACYACSDSAFVCDEHKKEGEKYFELRDDVCGIRHFVDVMSGKRLCPEHQKELEFRCKKCHNVPICSHCGLLGRHKGHKIKVLDDTKNKLLKESIEFHMEKMDQFHEEDQSVEALKREVDDIYDAEIERLEEERQIVHDELGRMVEENSIIIRGRQNAVEIMRDVLQKAHHMALAERFTSDAETLKHVENVMRDTVNDAAVFVEKMKERPGRIQVKMGDRKTPSDRLVELVQPKQAPKLLVSSLSIREAINTQSVKSSIRTPFNKWSCQALIYSAKHKMFVISSWYVLKGRNVAFINEVDKMIHLKEGFIPFNASLYVYDGNDFVYVYGADESKFGRINLASKTFEHLRGFEGYIHWNSPKGYFENSNLYVILRENSTKQFCVCKFNTTNSQWSKLNHPPKSGYTNLHKHPTKSGCCVEINENGIISEYDIETGANVVMYKEKYSTPNERPDSCVIDNGKGGFLLFCHFFQRKWQVFSSTADDWYELPNWRDSDGRTSYLCHVPEHHAMYYVIYNEYELFKVNLQKRPE